MEGRGQKTLLAPPAQVGPIASQAGRQYGPAGWSMSSFILFLLILASCGAEARTAGGQVLDCLAKRVRNCVGAV